MKAYRTLLSAHPGTGRLDRGMLMAVVDVLVECSTSNIVCADACLGAFDNPDDFRACVRRCLDCADVCETTTRMLLRQTETVPWAIGLQVSTCAEICGACADECAKHDVDYCRLCAEACQRCADRCRQFCDATATQPA